MSSEIVPFVDGNATPSVEPHDNTWNGKAAPKDLQVVSVENGAPLETTKPRNIEKGKEVVGSMDEGVRPFDLLGLRSTESPTVEHAIFRRPLGTIEEDVRPFDLLGLRSVERFDTRKGFEVEADLIGGNHEMRHFLPCKKGPKCVTKLNPKPELVKTLLERIKEPSVLQLRGCDQVFSPDAYPFSFEKFKTLTCLEISGVSNLTIFPENTISEMTQLQILNLSHLSIPQLPSYFFFNLVHLLSLTLKDCPNIHSIPDHCQMTALEYLELSHLPIQQLPFNFFFHCERLRSFTLKDCPNIDSIPYLTPMKTLEYLELSHLPIGLSNECFDWFDKLETIILRGCSNLSSFQSLEGLNKIKELDLSHCTALQEVELKNLSASVQKLDLSYTALHKLHVTSPIGSDIEITHLFLRDVKAINFQTGFPNYLFHLKVLDISGAQYVEHLDLIKESKALEALDLSRTRIESIDFISFMVNLRYLILRDCARLQKLPAMENLTYLEVLDISGCENLGDLPVDFRNLKKLKELNLSGCSGVKELSPTVFNGMTFLEKVDISKTSLKEDYPSPMSLQAVTDLDTLDHAAAPKSRIENLHPRLSSKPNEIYIVSTFFINSGFDRFIQHFDLIVDLISRFQENLKPVSSLDVIPIYNWHNLADEDIYEADKRTKTDAESSPISGQTVKMQCRRMVADLEYIRANIGLLESCPSSTSAKNLLDELTDVTHQFKGSIVIELEDDPSHFYFQLNSTNFYEVLRRVAKLKQLVPRKQVDALEEKKNKEKKKLEERFANKQKNVMNMKRPHIDIDISSSYESLTKTQKSCLLYFTEFPHDTKINERMLIEWWYGEGLIDPQHEENVGLSNPKKTASASTEACTTSITNDATRVSLQVSNAPTIEEIGQKILMVLQEKDFIGTRSSPRMGRRIWFVPFTEHSFVRERAMAEGFFNVDHGTRMLTPHIPGSQTTRLLIPPDNFLSSCKLWDDYTNSSEKIKCFKTIRRLLNVNAHIIDIRAKWFSKMTNLVVFHLGRFQVDRKEDEHDSIEVMDLKFLEELKNMKELRLLNLEGFLAIKKLPDSICKATALRILNLRDCSYLEELPTDIASLKNLTHLDLTNCPVLFMLPKGIRLLSKLEVLKGFVIYYQIGGRQHRNACTLRDLLKLEKLRILKLVVHTEKFPSSSDLHVFNGMKNLCGLHITWQKNYNNSNQESEDIVWQKASSTSRWNWHQLKCWKQQRSQNETDAPLLRSNIKKLELRCFPFETVPNWLQPSGLQKLERLYVRGGKLETLARNTNQGVWSVKILSLKYLDSMYMDVIELRTNFPHMECFQAYKCWDDTHFWMVKKSLQGKGIMILGEDG